MITFKSFLTEKFISQNPISEIEINEIREKCKPFLQLSKGLPLYRGMSYQGDIPYFAKFQHPVNRQPLHSSAKSNAFFNAMLKCGFGIEGIRQRSIFASIDPRVAGLYGTEYYIFPMGQISYLSSDIIRDLYGQDHVLLEAVVKALHAQDSLGKLSELAAFELADNIRDAVGQNTLDSLDNIVQNIDSEIQVEKFLAALQSQMQLLYSKNTPLRKIQTPTTELMIYESDGYYLLSKQGIAEYLNRNQPASEAAHDDYHRFYSQLV